MELTSVIIKPYLTEKTYASRGENKKKYAFLVNIKATKLQIKNAFISIFEIEPESVNTIIRKPSKTKVATRHPGYKKIKKIAYITLPEGQDISISQEEFENKSEENKVIEATNVEEKTTKKVEEKATKKVEEQKVESTNGEKQK